MKRLLAMVLVLLLLPISGLCETADEEWSLEETVELSEDGQEIEILETVIPPESKERSAKDDMIDQIIELGHKLYIKANGKAQRAHYSGDIYVCKNFTTYLFREVRSQFRLASYPDVQLVIPNNLSSADSKPYYYGSRWQEISASKGNPFYVAAQFLYNTKLSSEENMELALAFMRQVQRGDYFQMSADYRYGTGAHSAIMISDYDPDTDTVHWMDSNMRGKRVNGIRYGYVQYDEEQTITWWAEAFCKKGRGATLYRLSDDLIYASEVSQ